MRSRAGEHPTQQRPRASSDSHEVSQEREAHFNKEPTHGWGTGDPLLVLGRSHAQGGPKPLPVSAERTTLVWGQARL